MDLTILHYKVVRFMKKSMLKKIAPWIALAGSIAIFSTLLFLPDQTHSISREPPCVKISREQLETSLAAIIAENPTLKDQKDSLLEDIREGAVAQALLVAEAFSQGLAEKDYIVRNRLAELQIMALYEMAEAAVTSEAAVIYFSKNREKYHALQRRLVLHLFVPVTNVVKKEEAEKRLEKLFNDNTRWEKSNWTTEYQIKRKWGPSIARLVFEMPLNKWSQPIASEQGWHRIKVFSTEQGRAYEFDEVSTRVMGDLRRELKTRIYEDEIKRLKNIYKVDWTD